MFCLEPVFFLDGITNSREFRDLCGVPEACGTGGKVHVGTIGVLFGTHTEFFLVVRRRVEAGNVRIYFICDNFAFLACAETQLPVC